MRIPVLNLPPLPAGRHYRFHAMVKPGGARCNIDCDYCFYLHKTDLLEHSQHSQMSESTLEQHIRQYIEAQTGNEVVFSWQGGEPTLMGLPFFERIVALQARYAKQGNASPTICRPTASPWMIAGLPSCASTTFMSASPSMARRHCTMPIARPAAASPRSNRSWPQPPA